MDAAHLKPKHWYWVRRDDGSLVPYLFHRICPGSAPGRPEAEFFIGSMVQKWSVGRVVAEAEMPECGNRR